MTSLINEISILYAQYSATTNNNVFENFENKLDLGQTLLVGPKFQLFPWIPLEGLPSIKCLQDPTPLRRLKN